MNTATQLLPATVPTTSGHRRSWWSFLLTVVGALIASINEARRLRRAVGALHRLDDRTLADVGIARSGIDSAVRGLDHDRWPPTIRKS